MRFTKEYVEQLRATPLTDEEKELKRLENEWFRELAASDSDGVYEDLEPKPDGPSFAEDAARAAGWTPERGLGPSTENLFKDVRRSSFDDLPDKTKKPSP